MRIVIVIGLKESNLEVNKDLKIESESKVERRRLGFECKKRKWGPSALL